MMFSGEVMVPRNGNWMRAASASKWMVSARAAPAAATDTSDANPAIQRSFDDLPCHDGSLPVVNL